MGNIYDPFPKWRLNERRINCEVRSHTVFNSRNAAINDHPSILTDIFQENINIAIWERDLSTDIKSCVDTLQSHSDYQSSLIVKPDTVYNKLIESENAC